MGLFAVAALCERRNYGCRVTALGAERDLTRPAVIDRRYNYQSDPLLSKTKCCIYLQIFCIFAECL